VLVDEIALVFGEAGDLAGATLLKWRVQSAECRVSIGCGAWFESLSVHIGRMIQFLIFDFRFLIGLREARVFTRSSVLSLFLFWSDYCMGRRTILGQSLGTNFAGKKCYEGRKLAGQMLRAARGGRLPVKLPRRNTGITSECRSLGGLARRQAEMSIG
jgi:hypothetical protein